LQLWSASITSIGGNQMQLTWKAVKPLPISVSAEGYDGQDVLLDEHSPATLNVRFVRKKSQ